MANLLILGNTLVKPEEYNEKKETGTITEFLKSYENGKDHSLSFTNGEVAISDIRKNFEKLAGGVYEKDSQNPHPFTPIGLGLPLCVEILTVYTGDYPNGVFGGRKDLMLTSAVKSSITFDAASRAINKIDKKPDEKSYIEFNASEPGTRLVYYTPAVDILKTDITFELTADTFEQEFFEQVSKLMQSAASIPVFVPAASYLLGGSHLLKIAGKLGNTLFAKKSYLKDNFEVKFNNAGDYDSIARNVVICNDGDVDVFANYEPKLIEVGGKTKFRLVHKNTQEIYKDTAPYLIVNLDGQTRTDLSSFTPKLASSAILQKFYGEDDKQGAITETIEEAMKLYNDLNYKRKAEKLSELLKKIPKETDDYKKNEALLQAYLKNIQNEIFKPE